MQSIAIIINGNLNRNNKRFFKKNFYDKLKKYDLFISCYQEDINYIDIMNKEKIKYLNIENYAELKRKTVKIRSNYFEFQNINSPIYQWYHLDKIIKNNYELLKNYDLLMKVRPDMYFDKINLSGKIKIDKNSIYCFTDCLFYGSSDHFLKVFSSFYENIFSKYALSNDQYIPIKYKNILSSDINYSEPNNLSRLSLPKFIINKDIKITKQIIKKNIRLLERNLFNEDEIQIKKGKNVIFKSERSFLYHVVNGGKIKYCHFKCARPRKFFNGLVYKYFPLLDGVLLKIKNILTK